MELQKVETSEAAYTEVARLLKSKGHNIINTVSINDGRYNILQTNNQFKSKNFLVLFKRDFFRNFGKYFRDKGETGLGETINKDSLRYAVQKGVKEIIFIYPNGAIYSITVSDFLQFSHKRTNKENKDTRSISIHKLKRENKSE